MTHRHVPARTLAAAATLSAAAKEKTGSVTYSKDVAPIVNKCALTGAAVYPDGRSEVKEPLLLPKGSRLDSVAWEQMMIGWFNFTLDSQNLLSQR